jgi:MFS family permease
MEFKNLIPCSLACWHRPYTRWSGRDYKGTAGLSLRGRVILPNRSSFLIAPLGGLVWASMAPFYLFFGIYLRSLGLTYGTIGSIMTIGSILSSFPQIFIGAIADRSRHRKLIISFAMLARTAFSLMLLLSRDILSLSIGYIGMSFSLSGFMPLAQSIVADLSEKERLGRSLGRYRLFGSGGWAISCVLTGGLAEHDLRAIFPITFALSILGLLFSIALPEGKGKGERAISMAPKGGTKPSFAIMATFMLSVFLACVGMGAATSFLTISLSQLGMGAFFLGIVMATGAMCEVPAMYISGLLCDRIGSFTVLAMGEAGLASIYWLYGTVKDLYTYILVQGIRGILYSVFTISGMAASSGIGGRRRGSFFAGLYNTSYYLGTAPGPYLGGLISDYAGLSAMFYFASATSISSAILVIPVILGMKWKRSDGA